MLEACGFRATSLIARRNQVLAFFGHFNGCGTAGQQGSEVASDTELIAKSELTSKLATFVCRTDARNCRRRGRRARACSGTDLGLESAPGPGSGSRSAGGIDGAHR